MSVIRLHESPIKINNNKIIKPDAQILALRKNGIYVGGYEPQKWKNYAEEIHKSIVTEEVYEDKLKRQFQDAHARSSGFLDGLGSRLARTRMELFHAQRMKHPDHECCPKPVGGAGFAKVVSNPRFAEHRFFRAGRVFSIRLRHNNLTFTDDAMLDTRVVSIKFKDADTGGDLDLIMYTGSAPPYYNTSSFTQYVDAVGDGDEGLKTWVLGDPINYIGRVASIRRNPKSYYDQHYYSHVTYLMTSLLGDQSFARVRLLPADDVAETGLPERQDQENAWKSNRWAVEGYEKSYLRKEYKRRIRDAPVQYRLQIQTRPHDENDPGMLNPCLLWDSEMYPWEDLCLITITHQLKQKVLAKTHVDLLSNQMACFKTVEPQSMKDFASLVFVIREFHGIAANSQSEAKGEKEKINAIEVMVTIKTGSILNAGTDGDVYITIIGDKRRTEPLYLDTPFHDDFEAGSADSFNLTIPDVGEICAIKVELHQSLVTSRRWYLEEAVVKHDVTSTRFPCYQWLSVSQPHILLRPAKALLYFQESLAYGILQRKRELERRRELYKWERVEGLPGRIQCAKYENLPRDVRFLAEKERDLTAKYMRTLANSGVSAMTTLFDGEWNILEDYEKILTNVLKDKKQVKRVAQTWQQDLEFGRQMVAGANPTQLRRVTHMSRDLDDVAQAVNQLLDWNWTRDLATEIYSGNIYMVDFSILSSLSQSRDYKGKYQRYLSAPKCYLYTHKHGLSPIAIKLPLNNGEEEILFTPRDAEVDWLVAKMWVRMADAQVHQVLERHLMTSLTCEAFAMTTMRNLPSAHPVYKLLLPHLRYAIGINVLSRQSLYPSNDGLFAKLLAVGGQHMDLLKQAYTQFDISQLHLPNFLEKHGLLDDKKLPNYYYRDDGLLIWGSINKFIRTLIHIHYVSDENVRADLELQSWLRDLITNGFPSWPGDNTMAHGLPETLHNLEILIEILTTVIFTATARNAALTLGMMDHYSFVPNMPAMLLEAPPTSKGTLTMECVKKMLPSRGKTAEIIAACYTLSRLSKDEVFLGFYPEEYFDDPSVRATFEAFKTELDRIAMVIRHRNLHLDVPYTYLQPDNIPCGITM